MNIKKYKNEIIEELEKIKEVYEITMLKECAHLNSNGVLVEFLFEHKKHIDATCYATCYVDIDYNFKNDKKIIKNIIDNLKKEIIERIKEKR